MKPWIKIFLGSVIGFAGGFASGFFFHKKMNDVQFEEVTEEEMALLESQAEAQQKTEPDKDILPVENVQDLPDDPNKIRLTLQGKVSYLEADREEKEKYSHIWNTIERYSDEDNANQLPIEKEEEEDEQDVPSVEEGFDEEFLEVLEQEQVEPGQVEPPHVISLGEFYNERNEYDKITIDWYEPFTFLDEREEIIADISTYIGDIDIVKLFSKTGPYDDPDIRFIRNERYGTDYEIIKHHRTWSETTGGSE